MKRTKLSGSDSLLQRGQPPIHQPDDVIRLEAALLVEAGQTLVEPIGNPLEVKVNQRVGQLVDKCARARRNVHHQRPALRLIVAEVRHVGVAE